MISDHVELDLDAYLRRIGYDGPREATLATLRELHRLHPQAIAFENLDPFLHRPVALDLAAIEAKLVRGGRGGYCFEHNLLFSHALKALGFRVSGLAGRVLMNKPENAVPPRTHMLLRVDIGGDVYTADVGFGAQTQTAPLKLELGREQATPHETYRLLRLGGGFRLEARIGAEWTTLYEFDLQEQFPADYEVMNFYVSSYEKLYFPYFRHALIAARTRPNGRYALLNTRMSIHTLGAPTERRELATRDELSSVLTDVFGLTISDRAALDAALNREGILMP